MELCEQRNPTAVIIPTFRAWEVTKRHVELLIQNQTTKNFDIIIVDDGGHDSRFLNDLLKSERVTIVLNPKNLGAGSSWWIGAKYAYEKGYEIVILVDNDCFPISENLIEELCKEVIKEKHIAVKPLGFNEEFYDTPTFLTSGPMHYVAIHRNLIKKVGLPRVEFFIWCDDVEFYQRVANCNKEGVKVLPHILYVHDESNVKRISSLLLDPYAFSSRLFYHIRNNLIVLFLSGFKSPISKLFAYVRAISFVHRHLLASLLYKNPKLVLRYILNAFLDTILLRKLGKNSDESSSLFEPKGRKLQNLDDYYDYVCYDSRFVRKILKLYNDVLKSFNKKVLEGLSPISENNLKLFLRQLVNTLKFNFKLFNKKILVLEGIDYRLILLAKKIIFVKRRSGDELIWQMELRPIKSLVYSAMITLVAIPLFIVLFLIYLVKTTPYRYLSVLKKYFEQNLLNLQLTVIHKSGIRLYKIEEKDFEWLKKSIEIWTLRKSLLDT